MLFFVRVLGGHEVPGSRIIMMSFGVDREALRCHPVKAFNAVVAFAEFSACSELVSPGFGLGPVRGTVLIK